LIVILADGVTVTVGSGGASGQRSSQHPVDRLLRELLASGRAPTAAEVHLVVDHIATAPFNSREIAVDPEIIGQGYLGQRIPARASASLAQLWKRVLIDEQWSDGTTVEEYIADLRTSASDGMPKVMIAVIRESPSAGILAVNLTPDERRGPNAGSLMFIGYSVNGGMITTGYQTDDLTRIKLPGSARWLN
jgi:hypothetical protein